jgi:hypothetical protein
VSIFKKKYIRRAKPLLWTALVLSLIYSVIWIILFPDPQKHFAKRYENRTEIQKITGIELPKFKVIDSKFSTSKGLESEFETISTIEFRDDLNDTFFATLDSICNLPMPEQPNENSSYFYYSLEHIGRCWSKDNNVYKYERNTDFGEKFLHSKDAYFYLTIEKGSKIAELKYGNY